MLDFFNVQRQQSLILACVFLFMILYECQLNARHLLSLKAHDNEQLFSFGNNNYKKKYIK